MDKLVKSLEFKCFYLGRFVFTAFPVTAFCILLLLEPIKNSYDDMTTDQPWYAVSISVGNFTDIKNARVSYTQKVNRSLHGNWATTVYKKTNDNITVACSGSGYAYYDKDSSGTTKMSFNKFVGQACDYLPGQYRLCVNYDLEDNKNRNQNFGAYCAEFSVLVRKD